MCCFTGSVSHVSETKIFARGRNGHQTLVYEMAYAASEHLAMVLPLPVPLGGTDDAVRFVSLQAYPEFFGDLASGFARWGAGVLSINEISLRGLERSTLVVHKVGGFEASFVPQLSEFDRLDERFRISGDIWDRLPIYRDYGFAVFKLRPTDEPTDEDRDADGQARSIRRVHPMALVFPRRDPRLLYFPTLHIHDEALHSHADFDHVLYAQLQPGWRHDAHLRNWQWSYGPAGQFMDVGRAEGLIDPTGSCFFLRLEGRRQNQDTWVNDTPQYPEPLATA